MDDPTTVGSPTQHGVVDAEPIKNIHRGEDDHRRPENVASEIEHDVGVLVVAHAACDVLVPLGRHLHAGGELDDLRHPTVEVAHRVLATCRLRNSNAIERDRQHQPWIYTFGAVGDAFAAARAHLGPSRSVVRRGSPSQEADHVTDHLGRLCLRKQRRCFVDHGTHLDALAALRAEIGEPLRLSIEMRFKRNHADLLVHLRSSIRGLIARAPPRTPVAVAAVLGQQRCCQSEGYHKSQSAKHKLSFRHQAMKKPVGRKDSQAAVHCNRHRTPLARPNPARIFNQP